MQSYKKYLISPYPFLANDDTFLDLSSITLYFWGFYFIGKARFLLFLITVHEYNCCLSSSYDTPSFFHQFSIETMDHRWTIDGVSMEYLRTYNGFLAKLYFCFLFPFIPFPNMPFIIIFQTFCKISFLFLHNSKKKTTFVVDLREN